MLRRWAVLMFVAVALVGCGRDRKPTSFEASGVETAQALDVAAAELRAKLRQQENIRRMIYRLTTSGWRSAWGELVDLGHISVPHLINALDRTDDAYCTSAPESPLRVRPLKDVCVQILEEMVTYHSDYAGDLPMPTKEDWAVWWAENGEKVAFNR